MQKIRSVGLKFKLFNSKFSADTFLENKSAYNIIILLLFFVKQDLFDKDFKSVVQESSPVLGSYTPISLPFSYTNQH